MRCIINLTFLVASLLACTFALAAGDTFRKGSVITDVVVEYSAGGELIQVGDLTLKVPEIIMIDNGLAPVEATRDDIAVGQLVKATLDDADENGFWTVPEITILTGTAVEQTLLTYSEDDQEVMREKMGVAGSENPVESNPSVEVSETPAKPARGNDTIRFEDGVWKN